MSGAEFLAKRPRENAYNFVSLHYPTKDKRLIRLSIVNLEKDWQPFCDAISRTDFLSDERFSTSAARIRNMPTLIIEITKAFDTQEAAYWHRQLEIHDIPHALVPTYEEASNDQQKADNDIVIPLDHPVHGKMRTVNSPFDVSGADKIKPGAAPALGEHTRVVLQDVGYSAVSIEQMIADGIVG